MESVDNDAAFGFNNPAFCDWKLEIRPNLTEVQVTQPRTLRPRKKQKVETSCEVEGITLLVSALILGKHSEFFRRKIEEWGGDEKVIRLSVREGEEQYAKELVKFMYTEKIPYSECKDIIQLLLLAHQYLVPACEAQCLEILLEGDDLDMDMALELCRSHEDAPFIAQVIDKVIEPLLEKFGDLEISMAIGEMTTTFLSLPLAIVEELLGSGELCVMSENTAFTAAALWLESNKAALGDGIAQAWERLEATLRFSCMTTTFLTDIVMNVPWNWWSEKASVVMKAIALRSISQPSWDRKLRRLGGGEDLKLMARPPSGMEYCSIDLKVSVASLNARLLQNVMLSSEVVISCGYLFRISLRMVRKKLCVGISFEGSAVASISSALERHVFVDVERADICAAVSRSGAMRRKGTIRGIFPLHLFRYVEDVFSFGTLPGESELSELLVEAGYVKDGHIHLTAKIWLQLGLARVVP